MAQLRREHDRFEALDAKVVVVGPEGPEKFADYWARHELPFIGLPDPSHRVLKLYGQQIKIFKLGRMPAQVLVDRQGRARYVHYGHSMADIPANEELLSLLGSLNREAQHPSVE